MNWDTIDWNIIATRGGIILGIWILIWIVHRFLLRWIRTADRYIELVEFDDKDISFLQRIVDIAILVTGAGITLSVLNLTSFLFARTIIWRIAALALVWALAWILVRYLSVWVEALDDQIEGIDVDPRDLKTIDRLLDYLIIVVGVIISLAILNITSLLYSALTAAGVFGIIIGFAVKDIAANFVSGIFLLIDQPFVVGDVIQVNDFSGTVNKISLRTTEIISPDGPIVTIPNSAMAVEPIINLTLSQHRRVLFTISVLNTADLTLAFRTIQQILDAEQRMLPDKPPSILVNQVRDYAVDIQIVGYTRREDVFNTKSDLQKAVVAAFAQEGIELAVPLRVNVNNRIKANPKAGH